MKLFRLGTLVLALSTMTTLATGGSAAATLGPAPPADLPGSSTQQSDPTPAPSRRDLTVGLPDLRVWLFTFDTHLEPGEEFGLPVLVRNEGNGPAKPVQVVILFERGLTSVRVTDAPGFTCTEQPTKVICNGGQVPVGQHVAISLQAKAPPTPGDYTMAALVDVQKAVEEQNEENNYHDLIFRVRSGQ